MAQTPEQLAVQGRIATIKESLQRPDIQQDLLRYRKLQIQLACLGFFENTMLNLNEHHRRLFWAAGQKWIDGIEPTRAEQQKLVKAAYVRGNADEPINEGDNLAPYLTAWFEISNLLSQDKDDVILKHSDFNHLLVRIEDVARRDAQVVPKRPMTEDLNRYLKGFMKNINAIFKAPDRRIDLMAEHKPIEEDIAARRASQVELVGAVAERQDDLEKKALADAISAYRDKLSEEEEEEDEEEKEDKELEEFKKVALTLPVDSQIKFARALASFKVLDEDGDADVQETKERRQAFIEIVKNLKKPINDGVFENSGFMSKLSSAEANSLKFILRDVEKYGGKDIIADLFSLLNSAKINNEINELTPLLQLIGLLHLSKQKNEGRRRELENEFNHHKETTQEIKDSRDYASKKANSDKFHKEFEQWGDTYKFFGETFIKETTKAADSIHESRKDLTKLFQRNQNNKHFSEAFNGILEKFNLPRQKNFDPSQLIRIVQESNNKEQKAFQEKRLDLYKNVYNTILADLQSVPRGQKKARPESPSPKSPVSPSSAPPPIKKRKLKMASMIEERGAMETEALKRLDSKEEQRKQDELKQRSEKEREAAEHRQREEERAAIERKAHETKEREAAEQRRLEERRISEQRNHEAKEAAHELEQKRLREEKEKTEALNNEFRRLEELQRTQAQERAALERKWEQESKAGKALEKRGLQQERFAKSERFKAEASTDKDKLKQADEILTELNIYIKDLQAVGPRKKGFLTGTLLSDQEAKLDIAKRARANVLNLRESYTQQGKEKLSYQGKSPDKFYQAIAKAIDEHIKSNKIAHGFALIDKGKLDKILHKAEDLLAGKVAKEKKKKH